MEFSNDDEWLDDNEGSFDGEQEQEGNSEGEEVEKEEMDLNPVSVRQRIDVITIIDIEGNLTYCFCNSYEQNALEILSDFRNRAKKDKSRAEIMEELSRYQFPLLFFHYNYKNRRHLSEYFGYLPELSALFLELFSPSECVEFMDASDRPRPLVIRSNGLKTSRKDLMEALSKRGVNLEPVDW